MEGLKERFPDCPALLRELVRRGWLTRYQVSQLIENKGSGLAMGSYRILEPLGEGGMGAVYKARHARLDRLVALKIIPEEHVGTPNAVQRFEREARAAAQLTHPNVIVTYDSGEVDDVHFLAMEYLEGTDLARLVRESGPLPVGQACEFIRQAALGLQHAHERGVLHRDVKPGNLLVTRPPNGPSVVKVLDFGLARLEGEKDRKTRLTKLGRIVGTVDYIAPEQADNPRAADGRADVYSLGCSLYFLLTGQPPFSGEDMVEKLMARIKSPPPSVRGQRPEVPESLDAVVRKMMAREPEQRYPTSGDVAVALEPFAEQPGGGTPTGPRSSEQPRRVAVEQVEVGPATDPGEEAGTSDGCEDSAAIPASASRSRTARRRGGSGDRTATLPSPVSSREASGMRLWLLAVGAGLVLLVGSVLLLLWLQTGRGSTESAGKGSNQAMPGGPIPGGGGGVPPGAPGPGVPVPPMPPMPPNAPDPILVVRLVGGPHAVGDVVEVSVQFNEKVGGEVLQAWIERLGPNPVIPAIPDRIGRHGRRYAAGGYSIVPPLPDWLRGFNYETKGYPPGDYRFYVELKNNQDKVILERAVDFNLRENGR